LPNSARMDWPFPAENQDPWFDAFQNMVIGMDVSAHAAREDRNIFMGKGGTVSWSAGAPGTLSWSETLEIYSPISGFRYNLIPQSVFLEDGQLFYVDLVRSPTDNLTLSPVVASTVPPSDNAFAIAIRRGDEIYFRFGTKLVDGDAFPIFEGGGASVAPDIYERHSTFAVPDGSSTTIESTLGTVIYPGSIVGLALEITEAVTSGTVTVNIKRNAVTTLTLELNVGFPTSRQVTVASSVHPVVGDDSITVEVIPAAYGNGSGFDGGLTVNVAVLAGSATLPSDIPDASGSQKGITQLSLDPAIANAPIAVGDNDPRVDTWTNPVGTQVELLSSTDTVLVGTQGFGLPSDPQKVVIQDVTQPGITVKSDNAGGVEMIMYSGKVADATPAGKIGAVTNSRVHFIANNTPFWSLETSGNLDAQTNGQIVSAGALDLGLEPGGAGPSVNYLEAGVGQNAAVSAANKGRLRYNESTQRWEVSENTGGYVDMLGGGVNSTFERASSFAVDVGTATQEATLGRITFSGSIIGLSVHFEDTRTAGSATINVKKNGVTTLTADIDGGNTETVYATASIGTHGIAQDDEITVEIATTGYDNSLSLPTGAVINVAMTDTTGFAGNPNVALLDTAQSFSAGQTVDQITLTAAANVPVDAALSNNFEILLNQNVQLDNPTNVAPGTVINIAIRQDGGGTHTVTFGSAYLFPGGAPTITATALAEDMMSCYVRVDTAGTATTMLCSIALDHIT
jgi:hypothetical protein